MKKTKSNKQRLIASILVMVMMITSLIGTTFAWFTDSVTSSENKIVAGNLKIDLELLDKENGWQSIKESKTPIFNYDNWEPGYVDVKILKVENEGNLALKWKAKFVSENELSELANVIDVYVLASATELTYSADRNLAGYERVGTVKEFVNTIEETTYGNLAPKGTAGDVAYLGIALKMQESADNKYQGMSIAPFDIQIVATQLASENDSFGDKYDENAKWPFETIKGAESASASVSTTDGKVDADVSMQSASGKFNASVPAGTLLKDGVSEVTLTVSPIEKSEANIILGENEEAISLDVHVEGVAAGNDKVIKVEAKELLPIGLNLGNYKLCHVENGTTTEMTLWDGNGEPVHNNYTYDAATGDVTLYLKSFSEIALVADTVNAWEGEFDYSWYENATAPIDGEAVTEYKIANADQLAAFGAIVGGMNGMTQDSFAGKTVKLLADVNLGYGVENHTYTIFNPIGYYYTDDKNADGTTGDYYSTVNSFEGTFDGNGNTIANFYHNTWEIKGDYEGNYYSDAMGLFGYVNGGTVKNLTVDNFSSDGEFTPTGVIAAYATNSTFENIAITNCNPRVYNTGNGGIVGIGGNSDDPDAYKLTFTNITIDNTNKITALWGSWDVACGGLVGMFRGDGHVYMTNCHVAAQIDVYNDVCGNYQYYWYRYSGMMVGTNKNMTTDANGYTVPETDKFHAENCTVHFGDWNDYYYCELVANSLASYTHDHQFSRLTVISSLDEIKSGDTWTKAGNFLLISGDTKTCYHIVNKDGTLTQHLHTDAGEETVNGETVLKEDKQIVYLPFNQLFTGYGWGVKHIPVYNGENYAFEGITILDREVADSVEKFETKFTGDFLYRVGNGNAVSLGSLFAAKDGMTINNSGVWVNIQKVDENSNVSGTFTANTSDWTKGTIQFSGTGVVKVTIQDYNFCTPTELTLEVVDAVNATGATNATSSNVVLLQDCGFSSLEVSGGYTLYGNGFTMTCGSDSAALDMGYAFVTLDNGTLDNVQIVCPNFDYAVLYKSNMTESGNRSDTSEAGKTRYYNVKSGVMASGNSQILNSRISGARAAVNVSGGNVLIDNSRIELGAVASLLVGAANSVTLRDVTLVQKPTESTYKAEGAENGTTLMGFSVLFVCDANGDAAPVTLEGTLVQNAWVDENDKQYVPSAGQSIISTVLAKTEYLHDIDGDGENESLNLGFAYMPESLTSKVNTTTITDNRTNKDTVPYDYADVSILNGKTYVYSYKNTNGTADSFKTESEYKPNKYSDIITVSYSDTADGLTTGKSFGTAGWVYELNVDLDKLSGYALDFSKLSMSVNGVTVTDFKVDGNAKPTSPVAVVAGGTTYTLTATVNDKEYTATYKVTGTETSKESPSLVASNYEEGLCVASSYGGTWSGAAPALQGIQIKYWSVAEKQYKTITLSDYTPTTAGKQNGTNTTWTYSPANGDFTLTLTGGQVHSGNSVNAMPVVCDGKLYFVAASSNGLVNTGNTARAVPVSYSFKDNNNGDVLTFSHTWSVAENKDAQYKYSDFCDGTLTKLEAESSSGCVTPDTLITLADGTQKRVDELTGYEELLVWNMETGELDSAPIMFIDYEDQAEFKVVYLTFSDGTVVKVIYEHGFWDYDLNKYVYLDENAADYIGHTFAKQDGNTLTKVTLESVNIVTETNEAWSPVTVGHLCYFVNGMLSMPGGVGGLFNFFDVDPETMKYDQEAMERDIAKYGLYTYEEMYEICPLTEDMFEAAGGAYLKVSMGKGNLTEDELVYMITRYSIFLNLLNENA